MVQFWLSIKTCKSLLQIEYHYKKKCGSSDEVRYQYLVFALLSDFLTVMSTLVFNFLTCRGGSGNKIGYLLEFFFLASLLSEEVLEQS